MDSTSSTLTSLSTEDVDELCDLSLIYKLIYPKITQSPDLLRIEVLSRLSDNKSCLTEQFQKPSGLKMISKRFVEREIVRDLFIGDSAFQINKFYDHFNGDLLFIESDSNGEEKITRIDVIDSRTSKPIGSIIFNKNASNIQIVLNNENTIELNKLTELNGFIYFSNGNSLFNYSFLNSTFNLINSFDTVIEDLLLLNSTHLLVILRDSLVLLKLQNVYDQGKLLIEPIFKENIKIQFIESTIPKETVFNSQYLDGVDSILIIVGVKYSNSVKIYKFSNNNEHILSLICTIDSIKWSFYGYYKVQVTLGGDEYYQLWRESILIDESLIIDNMPLTKLNRVMIKFALQHEGVTKIIAVNDKGEFNIDEINESIFDIDDKHSRSKYYGFNYNKDRKANVELDSFKNDKILFKLRTPYSSWSIYLFNIENKSIISKLNIKDCVIVNGYLQHGLIVAKYEEISKTNKLIFYKINDDETIKEQSSVNTNTILNHFDLNKIKREMKIKNGKLLRIEPTKRLSIKEIDYLYESNKSINNDLIRVHLAHYNTMYEIDEKHILVKENEENKAMESKFLIVKVNDHKIVKTEVMEGGYYIFGYKNGFLVLFNFKTKYLIVYKIENKQDSFEFKQIFKQQIKGYPECHFSELKPNIFTITLYDETSDKIEVRFIEEYDENKLKLSLSTVSLNSIEFKQEWSCLLTSSNKYLFLHHYDSRLIYIIDITGDKIIDSIQMDGFMSRNKIRTIFNSNDLLVGCYNSLNYIKYDINSNKLNKIILKDYKQQLCAIEMQDEYLFVILDDSLEIYKLDDKFKNNIELRDPIILIKTITKIIISTNKKYLTILTRHKELCVYKLDNFNQIALLYLNDDIPYTGVVSNADYISFRFVYISSLITFEIIEKT